MNDFLKGLLKGNEFSDDSSTKWIRWNHISQGNTHCEDCLELDGCWFAKNKSPKAPLHPYCHCVKTPISYSNVVDGSNAQSAYSKFDPYLFNTKGTYSHRIPKTEDKIVATTHSSSVAGNRDASNSEIAMPVDRL